MADPRADRPSPQADLNARFAGKVAELEASGTLATDLTAPAPTVDAPVTAPAVAAPEAAPTTTTAAAPAAKTEKIPASGAKPPDDPVAPSTGPAATAIAKAQTPADVVLGTAATATPAPADAPKPAVAASDAAPGATTAPAAAAEPAIDWEDVSIDSGIPDVKYSIRAPKDQVEQIKRGFAREADYTRRTMALGRHRPLLTELLQPDPKFNNQTAMDVLAPYLDGAIKNPALGARMSELFARFTQGRPMYFADEIAPGGAPPSPNGHAAAAPGTAAPVTAGEYTLESLGVNPEDPWVEANLPAYRAMLTIMNEQKSFIDGARQQQQTQQTTQVQQQAILAAGRQARQYLEASYPGEYGHDDPGGDQRATELWNYARQQGYIVDNSAGGMAAGMLKARLDYERAGAARTQQAVASTAARSLAEVEAEAAALTRQTASDVASTVGPPNGATTPPAAVSAKAALRNADGSRRNPKQIIAEAAALALAGQR